MGFIGILSDSMRVAVRPSIVGEAAEFATIITSVPVCSGDHDRKDTGSHLCTHERQ